MVIFPQYLQVFNGIIQCVETVRSESQGDGTDDVIVTAGNECLSILCDGMRSSLVQCRQDVFSFALMQVEETLKAVLPQTSKILSPLGLMYRVSLRCGFESPAMKHCEKRLPLK